MRNLENRWSPKWHQLTRKQRFWPNGGLDDAPFGLQAGVASHQSSKSAGDTVESVNLFEEVMAFAIVQDASKVFGRVFNSNLIGVIKQLLTDFTPHGRTGLLVCPTPRFTPVDGETDSVCNLAQSLNCLLI